MRNNVAVLTLHVGDAYTDSVRDGLLSKQKYCQAHGYSYITSCKHYLPDVPIAWSKLPFVLENLDSYDWIFLSDADVIITNKDFDLLQFIESRMEAHQDIMISSEINAVGDRVVQDKVMCTGNMFFRGGSSWLRQFLLRWQNGFDKPLDAYNDGFWEQTAFNQEYNHNAELRQHTCLVRNQRAFNSFGTWCNRGWGCGDFLLHAARWDKMYMKALFSLLSRAAWGPQGLTEIPVAGKSLSIGNGLVLKCKHNFRYAICKTDTNNALETGEWYVADCKTVAFLKDGCDEWCHFSMEHDLMKEASDFDPSKLGFKGT